MTIRLLCACLPLLGSLVLPLPARGQEPVDGGRLGAQVESFLTGLHAAAAAADADRYLSHFREDAIILGTAPGERFTLAVLRTMVVQDFSKGRGWKTVPFEQHVRVSEDGGTAWFDERLRRETGRGLRATGVLRRGADGWKVVQLNNVFPVPNERVVDLGARLRKAIPMPPLSIPKDSPAASALLGFHRAGAEADLERHLGFLSADAILLGTDASERFTRSGGRAFLEPYFAIGKGIDTHVVVLHLTEGEEGHFAWFDARLDKPSLCELRGSGLLRRDDEGWKIVHYNRAFVIPNNLIEFATGG